MKRQSKSILSAGVILLGLATLAFAAPRIDETQEISPVKTSVAKQVAVLVDRDNDGLSDALQMRMAKMKASDFVDVIVTFEGPANDQPHAVAAEQAVGAFTLQREFTIIHGFKATMTVNQAQMLSRIPGVFRVQEDAIVTTQLSGATSDFGAVAARTNASVDGGGIGICIVDTGIDANHEQFAGRSISFYDAVNGATIAYDDHGHGTHVAAIALGGGGMGDNLSIVGVAPAASIFAAKALDALGSGSESQIIDGMQYCAGQAAVHIISMSLSTLEASDGQDAMSLAVNCISDPSYSSTCNTLGNSPKIVVVAAGNSGPAPGSVGSPGAAEKAVTVGAVANWSEDGRGVYLVAFSSRGPTLDGLVKPDISAPGVRILSAKAGDPGGYVTFSGTSMATPFTSGSVALILQNNPSLMDDVIPADTVRALLAASAQDRGVLGVNNSPVKPDNEYGAGLLDVNRAVAMADGSDSAPAAFPSYHREAGRINNNGGSQFFGPFTITEADIIAGIPFVATVTIEGNPVCPFGDPALCDLIGGWEWDPDLDVYLLDDKGNIVSGGSDDITISECALSGEACGVSRQETIHYLPPPIFTSAAGDYTIEVKSFSGGGDFFLEVSQGPIAGSPSTPSNVEPVASFIETCINLSCNFTDTSVDSDGSIVSWDWNFGDGFEATLQHPGYTYVTAGDYTVSLLVTDDQGATNITNHIVSVTDQPTSGNTAPIANAGGPYEATISKGKNVSVSLSGSGSSDPGGSIVSWIWTQNGQQIGSSETASVNFKEGIHTVRLTVTDNGGLDGWQETTVTILPKGGDSGGGGSGGGPDCTAKPNHPKC